MVRTLILATNNSHKVNEIRQILPPGFDPVTLSQAGIDEELPETSGTIPGNASQKARRVYELTSKTCIADDTGLIVPSLDGQPGVDSAYYAGLPRSDERNVSKLLNELQGKPSRDAYFLCVIALVLGREEYFFEGRLNGTIALTPSGNNGFGYDPVFIPAGSDVTLASLSPTEKNKISHRGRALGKLVDFLQKQK